MQMGRDEVTEVSARGPQLLLRCQLPSQQWPQRAQEHNPHIDTLQTTKVGEPDQTAEEESSLCRNACSPPRASSAASCAPCATRDLPALRDEPARPRGPALPCRDKDALPSLTRALRGRESWRDGFPSCSRGRALSLQSTALVPSVSKQNAHTVQPLEVLPSRVTGTTFVYV